MITEDTGRTRRLRYAAPPLFVIALLAAAINLRPALTSISAALEEVENAYGLSGTMSSVLVTLPVVVFAVAAPLGPWLAGRLGIDRALVLLQLLLAGSLLFRVLDTPLLLLGTATAAAAITAISILATAVFRRSEQRRAATLTSVFTAVVTAGASLGALIALPLIELFGGSVPLALACWAVPALAGAVALFVLRDGSGVAPSASEAVRRPTRNYLRIPAAWALAGYFGLQSVIFYGVTSWLPTMLRDRGVAPQSAAVVYVVVAVVGVAGSLTAPHLGVDPRRRPVVVLAVASAAVVGLLGLQFAPIGQRLLWAVLLGFSQGAAFALSLAFVVFRSTSTAEAASLSAMTQGIGYAIAALGPLLMGMAHDALGSWVWPALGLAAVAASSGVAGVLAGRDHPVSTPTG